MIYVQEIQFRKEMHTFWGWSKTKDPLYSTHPSPSFAWWYWQQSYIKDLYQLTAMKNLWSQHNIHGKINKHLREVHLAPSCFGLSPICADPNVGIATFRALYSPWLLQAVIRTILPAKKLVMMNHLLEKSIKVSRGSIRIVNRVECFKYIQAYTL